MRKTGLMAMTLSVLLLGLSACSGGGNGDNGGGTVGQAEGTQAAGTTMDGVATGGSAIGGSGGAAGQGDGGASAAKGEIKLPTGPVKLVVASFEPSEPLKQAVEKYEQAHPNVTIDLQAAQTEFKSLDDQIANIDKFVATTNTALLGGSGPDVVELDLLPKEKYVGRGLLADFNDFIERDSSFDKSDYFANVLDNLEIAGGLYAFPQSFYPVGLIGDEAAIEKDGGGVNDADWTWDDFSETAIRLKQKGTHPYALAGTPDYTLSEFVGERYSQFVDEAARRASFDSPAFVGLMEQVKKLYDDGVAVDLVKANARGGSDKKMASAKIDTYFRDTQIPSPMEFLLMMDDYDGHAKLYTKPHAKEMGPGGYFQENGTLGINAASPVKDQAWDFVKFLLSEQGAAAPDISLGHTGFPISRAAYDKEIRELRDKGEVPAFKNGPAEMDAFKVDKEKLNALDALVAGAVHPVGAPTVISDMIAEESKAFFAGQKSAEAVAKLIQNKVTTYLNE